MLAVAIFKEVEAVPILPGCHHSRPLCQGYLLKRRKYQNVLKSSSLLTKHGQPITKKGRLKRTFLSSEEETLLLKKAEKATTSLPLKNLQSLF
ncbi:hypothetical protein BgiBS90_004496 [Biomphalaria glabrata]|nr:hypothetical protein BgiBS90_004496 [Biomphalaria glabrata]